MSENEQKHLTLREEVEQSVKEHTEDISRKQYLEEVAANGCESGVVGELIYYTDTEKFYEAHKEEISELLVNELESVGGSLYELFGDKWDDADPLALDTHNQNLLAWYGYETICRNMLDEIENA